MPAIKHTPFLRALRAFKLYYYMALLALHSCRRHMFPSLLCMPSTWFYAFCAGFGKNFFAQQRTPGAQGPAAACHSLLLRYLTALPSSIASHTALHFCRMHSLPSLHYLPLPLRVSPSTSSSTYLLHHLHLPTTLPPALPVPAASSALHYITYTSFHSIWVWFCTPRSRRGKSCARLSTIKGVLPVDWNGCGRTTGAPFTAAALFTCNTYAFLFFCCSIKVTCPCMCLLARHAFFPLYSCHTTTIPYRFLVVAATQFSSPSSHLPRHFVHIFLRFRDIFILSAFWRGDMPFAALLNTSLLPLPAHYYLQRRSTTTRAPPHTWQLDAVGCIVLFVPRVYSLRWRHLLPTYLPPPRLLPRGSCQRVVNDDFILPTPCLQFYTRRVGHGRFADKLTRGMRLFRMLVGTAGCWT